MVAYIIIAVLGAACVVFAALWLHAQFALSRTGARVGEAETQARDAEARFRETENRLREMETQKREADEMQKSLRSIDLILKPFRDNLTDFRKRVEDIYSEENRQQGALKNELRNLLELNQRITRETTNLTSALKGSSKVQGDWGEMILERMLESSNLRKGVHYFVQENFKDTDSGANLRPDVVLTLPEGKRIVIDSKVSLTAYVGLAGAEDEAERTAMSRDHIGSIRKHVSELHARNYQGVVENSPDFVIMFVPSEPAFMAALGADSSLWSEAYGKKVIISSPTNLFALLRIVDDLWKRDSQSKHALEIARQGGALYDKFVGFVGSLEDVGRNLDRAQKSYDQALGQLRDGRGNLITSSERLRELGARASKKLPAQYLSDESDTERE